MVEYKFRIMSDLVQQYKNAWKQAQENAERELDDLMNELREITWTSDLKVKG